MGSMMNSSLNTPITAAPTAMEPICRPSLAPLGTEPLRAAVELVSHKWMLLRGPAARVGDGHPVVIFPGLGAGPSSVATLREHCGSLGYTALNWGRGLNRGPQGDVRAWLADLARDVAAMLGGHKQSATLIGWSVGGVYAGEVAKLMGDGVRQVITMGAPFNAEADYTNVGWLYRKLSGAEPKINERLCQRLGRAPKVPTLSIYSRTDGVVAWQTCCHGEEDAKNAQDVEVRSRDIGMVWNPAVLLIVGERLAQSAGQFSQSLVPGTNIH